MKSSQTPLDRIGTMGAARYLLTTKPPEQFQIELREDDNIQNYLLHLANEKSWLAFKNYILDEIKKTKRELSLDLDDSQLQKNLAQLELQEKNTQKIDALIHDGKLQEWLTSKDEMAMHMESVETVTDFVATIDEMIIQSVDYTEQLSKIQHVEKIVAITKTAEVMRSIPLINDYIRGLNGLREAYEAYRDPHIPQRKTKIAASLFGGLVSLGTGIVGSLLLAGAGLMATTAAIVITPIVIAALTVGVYSVALYRDGYVLHQAKKQFEKMKDEMSALDSDMASVKEIVISNYLNQLPSDQSIAIQNDINDKRAELIEFIRKNPVGHSHAEALRYQITDLCHKRNEKILLQNEIHDGVVAKFYSNPTIARLSIQKVNMDNSLNKLNHARIEARKKVIMSTLSCVGVGFALLAVCLTGGLALAVAAVATGILVTSTAAKLYLSHREKIKNTTKLEQSPQDQDQFHTSELQIEKRMLHGKQQDIARALANPVQVTQDLDKAKTKPVLGEITEKDDESFNEEDESPRSPKI